MEAWEQNSHTGLQSLHFVSLLQVFGKGAKFSLYKPAEEMVYISLDNESRTKGKAAIDVVGAQTGKSTGSILQQVHYLMSPETRCLHGLGVRVHTFHCTPFLRAPDSSIIAKTP